MKRHNPHQHDSFDDADWFDSDFDVDGLITSMEHDERRERRRNARAWQEKRRDERWLREELADWDSYDNDNDRYS